MCQFLRHHICDSIKVNVSILKTSAFAIRAIFHQPNRLAYGAFTLCMTFCLACQLAKQTLLWRTVRTLVLEWRPWLTQKSAKIDNYEWTPLKKSCLLRFKNFCFARHVSVVILRTKTVLASTLECRLWEEQKSGKRWRKF